MSKPRSPRSPAGAGNFSFKGSLYIAHQEKDWIEIQKTTFTNWCNAHLRHVGIEITDLASAFEDGVTLVHLVEAVSTKKISVRDFNKNPRMYAQKLDNITAAMKVLASDGIKLLSIGNEDILNGNLKLILGLIWRLILHYQISSSGSASGKQLLITWLRSAIPDMDIKNVTTDWNDGIALNALMEFCKPGLCPNYKSLKPENRLENVRQAMDAAEKEFGIPKVVSPEFFVSPYVDELSMMTYLSYFTQPGSIGEKRSLEYVNEVAPELNAKNFSTDWNDGKTLCNFIESLCPGTIPGYEGIDSNSPVENASTAIEAAHDQLGIRKVINAEEMTNPAVDELNIMAYVLQFRTCAKTQSYAHTFNVEGSGVKRGTKGKVSEFYVHGRRDIGVEHVQVDVKCPMSGKAIEVNKRVMADGSMRCQFMPLASGDHTISLKHVGKHLPHSPFQVKVFENVGELLVTGSGLKHAVVMKPAEFVVQTNGLDSAPITAIAEGPTQSVPVTIERSLDGSLKGVFTPREVGEHKIRLEMGNTPIPGSPFKTKVGDPSRCILGVKDGARFPSLGRPSSFEVDTSGAGLGELAIQCRGPNGNVPVDVRPTSAGKYIVSYIPNHRGEYNIRFMFNGEDITGSPYTTFVTDPTQIVTHGEGLNQAVAHSESKFFITLYGADKRDLDVKGEGPDGRFPVKIDESSESPDTYDVRYTPKGIGEHKIYVSHASIPVRGSPFVVKVADPTQVKFATHINGSKPKQYVVQNKVDIPVEVPRSAGDGNLEASVLGPDNSITAASVEEEQDGYHHIRFVPRTAGEHKVRVLYGGQEVSSPYSIQVYEAVTAKVKEVEPYYAKQEVTSFVYSESPSMTFASDPSRIEAHGEGLDQVVTDSEAEFSVMLHGAGKDDLDVRGEGPVGRFPVTLEESPDDPDTYNVRYTPQAVGAHKIHVSHAGIPVRGSPFVVKVADPKQVKLGTQQFKQQQPKQFAVQNEIDIPVEVPRSAGDGNLEASVVGPDNSITGASVEEEQDGYHHIRFVPRTAGEHKVRVLYGGQEVSDSPYMIQVHEAVTANVKEMEQTRTGYHAKREVDVPIDVPDEIEEISAAVKGPNNEYVQSRLQREADGLYHVRFLPSKAGKYVVDVRCAGEPVENSPFVMKIAEPENVQVKLKQFEQQSDVQYHMGHQVDVPMDIPKEVQDVTAFVVGPDDERAPSSFRREADGLKHLRFVPTKTGQYKVDIRCHGESVANSPFMINVIEPKSTEVMLTEPEESGTKYLVRRELDIALDAGEDAGDMSAFVDGPDGKQVPSSLEKGNDGYHHAKFVPYEPGTYKVHLRSGGEPVQNSPFLIKVGEPGKIRVAHVRSEELYAERVVKNEVDLALDSAEGMEIEQLGATVTGPDDEFVSSHISSGADNRFHVKFTPHRPGPYVVDVRYAGETVEGGPFTVNVQEQGRSVVKLNDAQTFNTTSEADVAVQLPAGSTADQLTATVSDPHNESLRTTVVKEKDSDLFHVRFVPIRGGPHRVDVRYAGVPLDNSPFTVNVKETDAVDGHTKCVAMGDGLSEGVVNEKTEFSVDTHRAGEGKLTSHLSGVKYNTDVEVKERSDGTYDCHYLVPVAGAYVLAVKWNGEHIDGSPYKVTVRQAEASQTSRLVVEGHALREGSGAYVGQPMGFAINSKDAGPGQLYVRCQGPSRDCDVSVFDNKDGTYQIQIHPAEVGNHLVYVEWGARPVHGSPFLVRVGQAPDPSKVRVYGPGLENGILRQFRGNFMVETKGAGPGTLKIRIHGPRGAFKVEMYRDATKERTIGVRYNPVEVGRYIINIKWADQHIPGSPFDVTIVDSREELDSINQLNDNAVPFPMQGDTLRYAANGYH